MIKRILITGDDGYNSVGIRALAKLLKKDYSVFIAATLNQQSAVGGKLNLSGEMKWGEDVIEDVPALWVDGTPADAMEVAQVYYPKYFDLIISGINFGENASWALVSSGTFSAAIRGLGVGLAVKAIAMSWQTTSDNFMKKHEVTHDMTEFLEYPGKAAIKVIEMIIKNDFYGKEIVNVNFPMNATVKHKIVKVLKDMTKLWSYPLQIDKINKTVKQPNSVYSSNLETDTETDVGALHKGFITISPVNYLTT